MKGEMASILVAPPTMIDFEVNGEVLDKLYGVKLLNKIEF
jgi:hypothetical protein